MRAHTHTHYQSETNRHSTQGTALTAERILSGRKCQVGIAVKEKRPLSKTKPTFRNACAHTLRSVKQQQSKKSGERELPRSRRAALDVFWSAKEHTRYGNHKAGAALYQTWARPWRSL